MSTLRCYVITDDAALGRQISQYIERTPMLECAGVYSSAAKAYADVTAADVDVVFAQARMPQLGGLELARLLPVGCLTVIVADTPGNAAEAFEAGVADYLLAPVSFERFARCVSRLSSISSGTQGRHAAEGHQSIFVKSDYKLLQLPLDDILFIEGLKDYVKFYLGQDQRSVMSLMSVKSLEAALPPQMFMRVHRSYIVNLRQMRVIDRGRIVFGPHYIPVSDTYRPQLQQYIASRSVTDITDNPS